MPRASTSAIPRANTPGGKTIEPYLAKGLVEPSLRFATERSMIVTGRAV